MVVTDELLHLKKVNAELLAALKNAVDILSEARRHNCTGFYCVVCNVAGLVEAMEDAIKLAEGK